MEPEEVMLRQLLIYILEDAGYIGAHGYEKSLKRALNEVYRLRRDNEELLASLNKMLPDGMRLIRGDGTESGGG